MSMSVCLSVCVYVCVCVCVFVRDYIFATTRPIFTENRQNKSEALAV